MLIRELRDSLERDDERGIDLVGADLQDALYDLNREVRIFAQDEDEDDFFGAVRRTFTGEDSRSSDRYDYQPKVYGRPAPDRVISKRVNRSYPGYQNDDWDDDDDWL